MLGTPRNYLSWSQMLCWEKGEDAYYQQYVLGRRIETREMSFGKMIASGLEKEKTKDFVVEFCRSFLPKPDKREHEILVNFEDVPLLVKMDGFSQDKTQVMIDEYKTGKVKWTQKRVDEHGQLTMYAMAVWKDIGIMPNLRLFWIPTRQNSEGFIEITGQPPVEFITERTIKDYMLMYARAKKAWEGINQFCQNI